VRKAYRMLRHKRLRHRSWWLALTRPLFDRQLWKPCRDTVASGLAIGLFFSMILILPMQMIFAAILAMRVRVNVPFSVLGCWVSNVFTVPFIIPAQMVLGNWMRETLHFPMPYFISKIQFTIPEIGEINAASFILGMFGSGIILAVFSYPLVHLFSAIMPHHLPVLKRKKKVSESGA